MAFLQFFVAIEQLLKHNTAVGIMFFCYGGANIAYLYIIK